MPISVARSATIATTGVFAAVLLASCGIGTSSTKSKVTTATTAKGASTTASTKATVPPPAGSATTPFPTIPVPGAPAVTPPATVAGASPDGSTPAAGRVPLPGEKYIVKSGDTMGNIAGAMNVKLQALLDANGMTLADANRLQPGKQLVVPEGGLMPAGGTDPNGQPAVPPGQAPPPTAKGGSPTVPGAKYTVKAGDYWILIAGNFGITLDSLLKANNANAQTVLQPGQSITIPTKTAANSAPKTQATTTTKKPVATTKAPTATVKPATTTAAPTTTKPAA
jgi:LysM repeat protein